MSVNPEDLQNGDRVDFGAGGTWTFAYIDRHGMVHWEEKHCNPTPARSMQMEPWWQLAQKVQSNF